MEWDFNVDIPEIVLMRVADPEYVGKFSARFRHRDRFPVAKIIARQGMGGSGIFVTVRSCSAAKSLCRPAGCRAGRAGSPCSQEFGERPGENQLPAAFTTTGAKIDDVIRRTNDLFFVLDHEQRVAFVAQIVHDADEPADIAGVQADTWLVHDKQRIDQ